MTRKVDRNGLQDSLGDRPLPQISTKPGVIASEVLPWKERQWNTKDLPWRATSDLTAAGCASGLVSPLITIIDRYVTPQAFISVLTIVRDLNCLSLILLQSNYRECLWPPHPPRLHPLLPWKPPYPASHLLHLSPLPPDLLPLLRHLRHSQQHRHLIQHPQQQSPQHHHRRPPQIPRHNERKHEPMPVQRLTIRENIRSPHLLRPSAASDTKDELRSLRPARLHDGIRILQPSALDRATPPTIKKHRDANLTR